MYLGSHVFHQGGYVGNYVGVHGLRNRAVIGDTLVNILRYWRLLPNGSRNIWWRVTIVVNTVVCYFV